MMSLNPPARLTSGARRMLSCMMAPDQQWVMCAVSGGTVPALAHCLPCSFHDLFHCRQVQVWVKLLYKYKYKMLQIMTAHLTKPPNSRMGHLLLGSGATVQVFDLSLTGQLVLSSSECWTAPAVHIPATPQRERINRERHGGCGTLFLSELRRWSQISGKSTKTFLDDTIPVFLLWDNLLFAWGGEGEIGRLIWKCCVAILMHLIMDDLALIL